jgi:peptidoglycan hydrolase-like protein with peptidoglycan-binding domain
VSRPSRVSPTLVALGALVVAAGTAIALVLTVPVDAPQALATATPAATVPVTQRADADERQVQLLLETGAPRAVVTTRAGTVTALHCTTGGALHSGDVVASVDGLPVIALATSVPLWRDLTVDDQGEDVRALQTELSRLGNAVTADGVVGARTLRAARQFLVARGVPRASAPSDTIPATTFTWIPAAEVTVRSCAAVVGAPVPSDGVLVQLPAELRSARLEQLPTDPVEGARRLTVGATTVDIRADGVIDDDAGLRSIGALPEYQSAVASADGAPTMMGTWALADPLDVDVVPPTALWDLDGGRACVQPAGDRPRLAEVIGSELGQAFVRAAEGERVTRVVTEPDRSRTCR